MEVNVTCDHCTNFVGTFNYVEGEPQYISCKYGRCGFAGDIEEFRLEEIKKNVPE